MKISSSIFLLAARDLCGRESFFCFSAETSLGIDRDPQSVTDNVCKTFPSNLLVMTRGSLRKSISLPFLVETSLGIDRDPP